MKKFIVYLPDKVVEGMLEHTQEHTQDSAKALKLVLDNNITDLINMGHVKEWNLESVVEIPKLPVDLQQQLELTSLASKHLIKDITKDDELIESLAEYCFKFCTYLNDKGFTNEQAIDILSGIKLPGGKN